MIEAGTWCRDVVARAASPTRALQEAAAGLLHDRVSHCMAGAARLGWSRAGERLGKPAATIRQVPGCDRRD